jgi:hypothetical protein
VELHKVGAAEHLLNDTRHNLIRIVADFSQSLLEIISSTALHSLGDCEVYSESTLDTLRSSSDVACEPCPPLIKRFLWCLLIEHSNFTKSCSCASSLLLLLLHSGLQWSSVTRILDVVHFHSSFTLVSKLDFILKLSLRIVKKQSSLSVTDELPPQIPSLVGSL